MIIVDAHSHLWLTQNTEVDGMPIYSMENGRSMFFGQEVQMLPPFMTDSRNTAEIFVSNMNYAQVSAAVVVQEFIDGIQNGYLAEVKRKFPDRFKVCAMFDYRHDGFIPEAGELISNGIFDGVAIPGHRLGRPLNGSEMMEMFALMEEKGLFLSLCLHEDCHQIPEVEDIIFNFPHLRIAIGHFGMVTTADWMKQINLARHENVSIECGGITWLFNSEFYPFNGAVEAIRKAADEVGIKKLMWGSDYPRTITAITYRMSYDFILKSELLSGEEKILFLGKNAAEFYNFKNLAELPYIKNMSE